MPRLVGYDDDGKAADTQNDIIIQNVGAPEVMRVASWVDTRGVQDIHAEVCVCVCARARGIVMSALQIAQTPLSDTIVALSDGGRDKLHALVVCVAIMSANSIMDAE